MCQNTFSILFYLKSSEIIFVIIAHDLCLFLNDFNKYYYITKG